jgi:hypothetical protein
MNNPITPLTPAELSAEKAKANAESALHEDLVVIDQALGKIIGGAPDITMSSDLAMMATEDTGIRKEIGVLGSKILDYMEPDHGAKAEAADIQRAEAAVDVLKKAIETTTTTTTVTTVTKK